MNASIVNLSRRVADIRSLRAAAFFPRILAVVFLFGSVIAYSANPGHRTAICDCRSVVSWSFNTPHAGRCGR
jgi:hypothetical protein